MEKVNVINSNGNTTNIIVNDLLESALKFYGKEYEDVVIQTIRDTNFYEVSKHENINEVITKILGRKSSSMSKNDTGCFLYPRNPEVEASYNDTVLYRIRGKKEAYVTLAHELFGHAVCGKINRVVYKDNKKYNRNGLFLYGIDNNEIKNKILNEGFADFIAELVVNDYGMKACLSESYKMAKESAKALYNYIGRENILKALVLSQYDIERELQERIGYDYFKDMSILNDERYKYKIDSHYIKSHMYKQKIKNKLKKIA